jgi:hypothetical protein
VFGLANADHDDRRPRDALYLPDTERNGVREIALRAGRYAQVPVDSGNEWPQSQFPFLRLRVTLPADAESISSRERSGSDLSHHPCDVAKVEGFRTVR